MKSNKVTDKCVGQTHSRRNALLFFVVFVVWFTLDYVSKKVLNDYTVGQIISDPILGIFRLRLVHNTGMAWGMFADSTILLGVVSVVVCLLFTLYLFMNSSHASVIETLGIALVVAGGIGNALDRFVSGYVVDFIDLTFMDFPVFNIADIGVTCGFILFVIALICSMRKEDA